MKHLILWSLLGASLFSANAQTNGSSISPEVAAYDRESIRLLGEGMGYVKGDSVYESSLFNRKMRGQLQGDTANVLLNASVKNQRNGLWNGLGGLILTGAGLAAAANTPVGWVVVVGGAVWYVYGLNQQNKGFEQLHQAIWLHNRAILIDAKRP